MSTFLGDTARHLYSVFGEGLSNLTILFPGQRATRFFSNELLSVVPSPIWEPTYVTIDRFMSQLTGLEACNRIVAITKLYEIYSEVIGSSGVLTVESFDKFYGWGEKLLANFDAVDKYMVDAKMLFCNISDLKEIASDNSYFDERQREIIKRFFLGVDIFGKQSKEKSRFVSVWNHLYDIYAKYRESLQNSGLAYSGMIYRATAEAILRGEIELSGNYAIIGFNALSKSERILFDRLRTHGAMFFWDYDDYYVNNQVQEAGLFLRENIKRYPSQFHVASDNFTKEKNIRVISAPTDSLQCKYVNQFLSELNEQNLLDNRRTAIVLTDESLLLPVLHSLPEGIDSVNVTMGYPLKVSMEYSLVERLVRLQNHCRGAKFYHRDVKGLLNHPLIVECVGQQAHDIFVELSKIRRTMIDKEYLNCRSELLDKIFVKCEDIDSMTNYIVDILCFIYEQNTLTHFESEILGNIVDSVYRLRNSLSGFESKFDLRLYTSLMLTMLKGERVPFRSESVSGIQIMGILETRNLDFDNVLILSMNEDTFPGNLSDTTSFIPYSLREGYGLPTPRHHEGVYAYYFYRLLQRARNIDMVYCTKSDDRHTGEQSRYISQLIYEDSWHNIKRTNVKLNISLSSNELLSVDKDDDMIAFLRNMHYSPSSLCAYMSCPYKFYLKYIKKLKPQQDDFDEEIDSQIFGTLIHQAMENLYLSISKLPIDSQQSEMKSLINSDKVVAAVNQAIQAVILGDDNADIEREVGGEILIARDILVSYINKNILPYDAHRSVFGVDSMECPVAESIDFPSIGTIKFKGIIDRLDRLWDGRMRIVDYKTGTRKMSFTNLVEVFTGEHESSAVFQVLLYSILLKRSLNKQVLPEIYQISKMSGEEINSIITINNEQVHFVTDDLDSEFVDNLNDAVFRPLFDKQQKFIPTTDSKRCEKCDYSDICGK